MKITKGGLFPGLITNAADTNAVGGVTIDNSPSGPGQALVSNQSNFNSPNGASWQPIISTVTSNGSNSLLGPHVNFASGSNVTFSVSSNTLTISSTGGTSGSFVEIINGGGETVQAHGSFGSTEAIDTALGNYHWGTLNTNCTFSFATLGDTKHRWFLLELIEDGTGGWSPTFPGSVVRVDGNPAHVTTAGTTTVYIFWTRTGGAVWYGGQIAGGGGSVSFGTVATDVGGASLVGIAATSARSDHAHLGVVLVTSNGSNGLLRPIANFESGMGIRHSVSSNTLTISANLTADVIDAAAHWELVMQDGVTAPPEPVENEARDDWLYGLAP